VLYDCTAYIQSAKLYGTSSQNIGYDTGYIWSKGSSPVPDFNETDMINIILNLVRESEIRHNIGLHRDLLSILNFLRNYQLSLN
jgi:hypothetical protein